MTLVIRADQLISGERGATVPDAVLVVENGRIAGVFAGNAPDGLVPPGAEELDYRGCTLLPGLIDAHVHLNLPGDGTTLEEAVREADGTLVATSAFASARALAAGITTLRDVGGARETVFNVRRAQELGHGHGARIIACGQPLTITGGHTWYLGGEADGEEALRRKVREMAKFGADFIKVMASGGGTVGTQSWRPSFRPEELAAIADEAHRLGRRVAAHCLCAASSDAVVAAGMDHIEHAGFITDPTGRQVYVPATAERIASAGIPVSATLAVGGFMVKQYGAMKHRTPSEQAIYDRWCRTHDDNVRQFSLLRETGVTFVAGTDAGWRYTPIEGLPMEIALMNEGGLSTIEVDRSGDRHRRARSRHWRHRGRTPAGHDRRRDRGTRQSAREFAAPVRCAPRRSERRGAPRPSPRPGPALMQETAAPILAVRDLRTYFRTVGGTVKAVDGVGFDIAPGTALGIVGESGSGKSVTSLSVMGLVEPPGWVAGGEITFKGRNLATLRERERRAMRGRELCLVFQDPMSALNPVYTVGAQMVEALQAHLRIGRKEALDRSVALFRLVGIPAAERRIHDYPHRLSGGMRQRVTIAMAIAHNPELLILDEPTTALDATVQAQILDLIRDLRHRVNTAVLLITHDIGVVQEICDTVLVMYGGRVMERGTVAQITEAPRHPYTMGLLASMPSAEKRGQRLPAIGGMVPNPLRMPPGCPFQPRCTKAMDVCATMPTERDPGDGRRVACWLY